MIGTRQSARNLRTTLFALSLWQFLRGSISFLSSAIDILILLPCVGSSNTAKGEWIPFSSSSIQWQFIDYFQTINVGAKSLLKLSFYFHDFPPYQLHYAQIQRNGCPRKVFIAICSGLGGSQGLLWPHGGQRREGSFKKVPGKLLEDIHAPGNGLKESIVRVMSLVDIRACLVTCSLWFVSDEM